MSNSEISNNLTEAEIKGQLVALGYTERTGSIFHAAGWTSSDLKLTFSALKLTNQTQDSKLDMDDGGSRSTYSPFCDYMIEVVTRTAFAKSGYTDMLLLDTNCIVHLKTDPDPDNPFQVSAFDIGAKRGDWIFIYTSTPKILSSVGQLEDYLKLNREFYASNHGGDIYRPEEY